MNYARQSINSDDITAVMRVLESDYLTKGPMVDRFEKALCEYTGAPYCAVVSSGTAALHLAVKVLKQEHPHLFMGATSANTFIASANCLRYNNIHPEFVDIDLHTYNMQDYTTLETSLYDDCQIIVQVHFAGLPSMGSTGCFIIEDACHALGARYETGEMVGCGKFSEMTCFSFHPTKTITTGEGGAVTSKNQEYIREIKRLRDHGTENMGFNYRMTDFQAALGMSQLERIDDFLGRRKEIFLRYNEASGDDWAVPVYSRDSSCNLYVAWFELGDGMEKSHQGFDADNLVMLERLQMKGIIAQIHYRPTYRQRCYGELKKRLQNAEEYSEHALTLPLYPAMTDEDVEYVIKSVKRCL